ncbi:unnamed protein product [Adineta ricciae]|uniref:Uncharacterized protein n=1 Tax=Adineta ricciae TaxID=249248 RepID=A0A816H985_ADIRI|nr:unnamed protein product [Adineta ricciae]
MVIDVWLLGCEGGGAQAHQLNAPATFVNILVQKFNLQKGSSKNVSSAIQAIEVVVSKDDFYILVDNSSIDRLHPEKNLIVWYGKCCEKDQFKVTLELFANTRYILVVTTENLNVIGPFSITIFGSNKVHRACMRIPTNPSNQHTHLH